MRRTKIVATLGPSSVDPDMIRKLIEHGVDVFRLNFSHGTRCSHRAVIDRIRDACQEAGREVAILQDLCGPKIRSGIMRNGAVTLIAESEVTITTKKEEGTSTRFSCNYKNLPADVSKGSRILLDDGKIELEALSSSGDEVRCRVVRAGILKNNKGINLPGTHISSPSVTLKDVRDLAVGLEEGVDFIALSFVRHPDDIRRVRKALAKHGAEPQIIAKIEKPEAIEYLEEIINEADGVMVARGDLGVEMELQKVPVLQKKIIRLANEQDKIVITATQMLESMTTNPTPTRAEVSDVANAIFDGTDALMLSGESAIGAFPLEAVDMLDKVAREAEDYLQTHRPGWDWDRLNSVHPVQDALGHAATRLYEDLNVKAITTFSASGSTALFLSKSRPFAPIIAFTGRRSSLRRMRMIWGVEPRLNTAIHNPAELREVSANFIRRNRLAEEGDGFLIVAGTLFGQVGGSNSIEISQVPHGPDAAKSHKAPINKHTRKKVKKTKTTKKSAPKNLAKKTLKKKKTAKKKAKK